jgi:tetratricopeptide (TPR) repeat protein
MRLAIVIRSIYGENGIVPSRRAFEDTGGLVESRFSGGDIGFNIMTLPANRDLPENLDKLFSEYAGRLDVILVHFAGYLAVKPDRGPAMLLDGSRLRAFPISRLRAAIANATDHALVIMDALAITESAVDVNEVASGLCAGLHESTPHIAVMASVALPETHSPSRRGCFRLSDLWLLSLDAQLRRANGAAVLAESVVRGVQGEPLSFASLPSFDYRPSEKDFVLFAGSLLGGQPDSEGSYNRTTLQSAIVSPVQAPPTSSPTLEVRPSAVHHADTLPDDVMVDSQPAAQVNDDELLTDDELPSIPPAAVRQPRNVQPDQPERAAPVSSRSQPRALQPAPESARKVIASRGEREDTLPGATRPVSPNSERPSRPSQPSIEDPIDRAIDWADRLAYRGDAASAIAEYKRLIADLKPTSDQRLATLHASLGVQYRKLGDIANALTAFEETLTLDPKDELAQNGTYEIHRERQDWDSLSQTVRRRLHAASDTHEKADLLDKLTDIWLNQANDPRRAISVIEERLALTPNDIPTLERLVEAYDRDGDALARIAQREKLASVLESFPVQKSLVLVESASITLQQLNNLASAQNFVDRAIVADPSSIEAFELSLEILHRQKLYPAILQRCVRVLSEPNSPEMRYQAASRLLDLIDTCGPSLDISVIVVDRLEVAVGDDEELKQRAMKVLAAQDAYAKTTSTLQNSLAIEPRNPQFLRDLSDAAVHQNDHDLASLAASVLVGLKSGTADDESRYAALGSDRLVRAERALSEIDLTEKLLVHDVDVSIFKVLSRLHDSRPKVSDAELTSAVTTRLGSQPDLASMETPERILAWTAAFVGVSMPELVSLPEHSTPLELVLGARPRLLHGVELTSRLASRQLAFIAARTLALLRPEFLWRAALPTQDRVQAAIGLCIRFAREGSDSLKSVDESQKDMADGFVAHIESQSSLADSLKELFSTYGLDNSTWAELARSCIRAADRALLRVGLVACANPGIAIETVRTYPLISPLSLDDQIDEIARFATSRAHWTLRKSLGISGATTSIASGEASTSTRPDRVDAATPLSNLQ